MASKLSNLKQNIQNGEIPDSLIVFKWSDNPFIAHQYTREIAHQKQLEIKDIDDFDAEFKGIDNEMFDFDSGYLKLLDVDKFSSNLIDELPYIRNTVVICKDIDEGTEFSLAIIGALYEVPKLKSWQIKSFIRHECPGLSEERLDWLCDVTSENIYRIANEIDKVSIFDKEKQNEVFDLLEKDGGFADLNQRKLYDLTNPITGKNLYRLTPVLKDLENMEVNEYSLVSILKDSFELLMRIQLNPSITAEELGIKPARLKAIKWDVGKYTNKRLTEIYKFLTDFDYNLKSGNLDIKSDRLVDYIICKIIS